MSNKKYSFFFNEESHQTIINDDEELESLLKNFNYVIARFKGIINKEYKFDLLTFIFNYRILNKNNIYTMLKQLKYRDVTYYDYGSSKLNPSIKFSNFQPLLVINRYCEIIREITNEKPLTNSVLINITNVKKTKMLDVLKLIDKNNNKNQTLVDIYFLYVLEAPAAIKPIDNFLYLLRNFALYNYLIMLYIKKNRKDIYDLIENNRLEIGEDDDEIEQDEEHLNNIQTALIPIITTKYKTFNRKNIINLFSESNSIDVYNLIPYVVDDENEIKENIINNYSDNANNSLYHIDKWVGVKEDDNRYRADIGMIEQQMYIDNFCRNFLEYNADCKEFNLILRHYTKTDIENMGSQQIKTILSYYLTRYFYIYEYLMLNDKNSIFIDGSQKEEYDFMTDIESDLVLKEIAIAFCIFKNATLYKGCKNMFLSLHFYKYILKNSDDFKALFVFLSLSTDKTKVIYEYDSKQQTMLSFLDNLYNEYVGLNELIFIKKI